MSERIVLAPGLYVQFVRGDSGDVEAVKIHIDLDGPFSKDYYVEPEYMTPIAKWWLSQAQEASEER